MDSGYGLEGSMRLEQMRKTKYYLYMIQLMVVLLAIIILLAISGGVSIKPFYLPIGSFIYFLILMLLVFGVEGFVFMILELRFTKSSSSKIVMVQSSIRRSIYVIIVSAIVLVMVLTPFMNDVIANYASESGTTSTTAPFYNRDPLGITSVDYVTVSSTTGSEVLIISAKYYEMYKGDLQLLRQFSVAKMYDVSSAASLKFPVAGYEEYLVVAAGGEVTYTVHKVLSPVFTNFVTLFALLFIACYGAWVFYLTPLKRKYTKSAIYR